jgi:hypothetical protein
LALYRLDESQGAEQSHRRCAAHRSLARSARNIVALFGTNLLDRQYFESYIDSSALIRAGLPAAIASDLGIMGDRRRVGIRGKYSF